MSTQSSGCGHHHHRFNRRDFVKLGGAAALGVVGAGMVTMPAAAMPSVSTPKPLTGFSPILQSLGLGQIPHFLPGEIDPFTNSAQFSPATIEDFMGEVGVVEIDGITDNNSDGVARRWACDIRYMDGVYRDRNDRVKRGTFAFL